MSRSKHTDPDRIRAQRRVFAPRDARGVGDLSGDREARRLLKVLGLHGAELEEASGPRSYRLPRVREVRPRPGFLHPASPADIRSFLSFFGPVCAYGIRLIELRQQAPNASPEILLAVLRVPGTILMFEQPASPWLLSGQMHPDTISRLIAAGARIETSPISTIAHWPDETLRDFILFDGLMHEIGHHLVQQYRGKRESRVMRTKDHERRASAFADLCRHVWKERADGDRTA